MTPQHFTIISYNVCGVNNPHRIAELEIYVGMHQPSVLVLQEPKVNHTGTLARKHNTKSYHIQHPPSFTNYSRIEFNHATRPTGILMYIHKSCTFQTLHNIPHSTPYNPKLTSTVVGFVWVSSTLLPSPIIIGGTYLACNAKQADISSISNNIGKAAQLLGSPPPFFGRMVAYEPRMRTPQWRERAQAKSARRTAPA